MSTFLDFIKVISNAVERLLFIETWTGMVSRRKDIEYVRKHKKPIFENRSQAINFIKTLTIILTVGVLLYLGAWLWFTVTN